MAQRVICPICGTESEDDYCQTCCSPIQNVLGAWDADVDDVDTNCEGSTDVESESCGDDDVVGSSRIGASETGDLADGSSGAVCPECGKQGAAGTTCFQCGTKLPDAKEISGCGEVALTLPDGSSLSIAYGEEAVIGRESPQDSIARQLKQFPVISRKHCTISVNADGTAVSVRDLGSLNGTWVEDGGGRAVRCIDGVVSVPARIRLGSRLWISVG